MLNKISKLYLRIKIYASALRSWGFNNNEMLSTFSEEEESDFDLFFWIINIRDKVIFNKIKLGTSDSKYIKLKKKHCIKIVSVDLILQNVVLVTKNVVEL
jgi:hypothetical protein